MAGRTLGAGGGGGKNWPHPMGLTAPEWSTWRRPCQRAAAPPKTAKAAQESAPGPPASAHATALAEVSRLTAESP